MGVALDHHHLGAVRYAPWVLGRWAAGAAGNRKIQRAPEEVHGADLAREPRTELSEYTVGGDELLPDGVGVRRVVLAAGVLLVEEDDHLELDRNGPDRCFDPEVRERVQRLAIEH